MTTLNVALSPTLQSELATPGVWAYAVYFDSSGNNPVWTDLVTNGLVQGGGNQIGIPLPGTLNGGKIYFIVQSQPTAQPNDLRSLITTESRINWDNAGTWDFRFDSFEVSLLGKPTDAGNLTSVNGFGLPMEVSVPYDNGTTGTVGYGITASDLVGDINAIDTTKTYSFTYTEGPLANKFRMALSPAQAVSGVANPPFTPGDWSDYIASLEGPGAQAIVLTGLFNGAPDAANEWHNGGFFDYRLEWDSTAQAFWLVPQADSQIKGAIELTVQDLENSIYSTLGNAGIYTDKSDAAPYLVMNTGANNQWGKVLAEFLTGFTGGFYGTSGKPLNDQLTDPVDLNVNRNWDPDYAFGKNLTQPAPAYQADDPYSEIFYQYSNSYGSGYSDALMSQYAVGGPLISVSNPIAGTNVANINLTIFADGETPSGYVQPRIYNYIAPPGDAYAVPGLGVSTVNIVLNFAASVANNAGVVLDGTATVTLRILTSDAGGTPVWAPVAIDGSAAGQLGLWQNWNIVYHADTGTFTAEPFATPVAQPAGSMLLNQLPVAANGVAWYQIVVGDKTYNLYTTTSGSQFLNPAIAGQEGALAIDGLATVTPQVSTSPTIPTFSVNFSVGDTLTYGPSQLVHNTSLVAGLPLPNAPVVGTLSGDTFTALPGQTSPVSNTVTAVEGDFAFAWTGENPNALIGATPWVMSYTNKIDALTIARVTVTLAGGEPIVLAATADVDGQWQTSAVHLSMGSYTVTMAEFLPGDTSYTTPLTPESSILTLNLEAVCFVRGTRIRTPGGDVAVEDLAAGDKVVTAGGRVRGITWVGVGKVLATRGRRTAATPVIVRKGALADNVPNRDLHVTKGHSLYLDGVLVPVECLVNHRSIVWDDRAQEVEVYHVELVTHDVLLANGAPAESYRDDGNRWLFRNANARWDAPPVEPCAPVLTGGAVVDALWQRLLDRAGSRPGTPTTEEPDLHLLVDGVRVDGRDLGGGVHAFRLTRAARSVRIASRAAAPDELGTARDPRLLGVALRRIVLWHGRQVSVLEADDVRLCDGFHAFEASNGWRWTDGDAVVPEAAFLPGDGACELELHIGCTARYPQDGRRARTAA
ncbi:MAG: Hint domain-containing protein [Acetobacteraceae bacterium]